MESRESLCRCAASSGCSEQLTTRRKPHCCWIRATSQGTASSGVDAASDDRLSKSEMSSGILVLPVSSFRTAGSSSHESSFGSALVSAAESSDEELAELQGKLPSLPLPTAV